MQEGPETIVPQVRDSWQELHADAWLIGGKLHLARQTSRPAEGAWWDDGNGTYYAVSETADLSLPARPLQSTTPFPIVYDAGNSHAVWKVGNAFVKIISDLGPSATREHVTLDYVREMERDFAIPEVIYHGEWDGRYYLILSRVAGQTLHEAWPVMSEAAKTDCVARVARICSQLAARKADYIGGVDGHELPENWLARHIDESDCSRAALLENCNELGMSGAPFHFYHCDLGAGNVLVDLATGAIAIIDWECAGFVPREWVRTKFRICSGLDLELPPGDIPRHDWRSRMQQKLEADGFNDIAHVWMDWFRRNRLS